MQLLQHPSNSGAKASALQDGILERGETYHVSAVSAGIPFLLTSWETLVYLLPQGLTAIAKASEELAAKLEESLQQRGDLPPIADLKASQNALSGALESASKVLEPLPRRTRPVFWVSGRCGGAKETGVLMHNEFTYNKTCGHIAEMQPEVYCNTKEGAKWKICKCSSGGDVLVAG